MEYLFGLKREVYRDRVIKKMIISASRRTDIPSFYSDWFKNRIMEGYCQVKNPFNAKSVADISLKPEDVEAFIFWTRDASPFKQNLFLLDNMGYFYYFQYTLVDYPDFLESDKRTLKEKLLSFKELSNMIGYKRVIWRYDPVFLSERTGYRYHIESFGKIAREVAGYTQRVIISFVDLYPKVIRTLGLQIGEEVLDPARLEGEKAFADFVLRLKETAADAGMSIGSCAEKIDLTRWGIKRGKCIDDALIGPFIKQVPSSRKDPGQRALCRCVVSKDIGRYGSCPRGCLYCYAAKGGVSQGNMGHDKTLPFL